MAKKRKATTTTPPKTRFAALVRVSTEKQEDRGASLAMQHNQLAHTVDVLGGEVVAWFEGQEHATPEWERGMVSRMLDDAEAGRFDAVIVVDPSRWQRDNVANERGLDRLRDAGVRFFAPTEYDLFDPHARQNLRMSAGFNQYQAEVTKYKSVHARIHRAKEGRPVGSIPWGRTFDKSKAAEARPVRERWGVDPEIQRVAVEIATRYAAGESMDVLAKEYGFARSFLHEAITKGGIGEGFVQSFRVKQFGIDEKIKAWCPRLVDEDVIQKVQWRVELNKGQRGPRKHRYLLSGLVRCAACGYLMTGRHDSHRTYYKHGHRTGAAECPVDPRPQVRCDALDFRVLESILRVYGNERAMEQAIRDAYPNADETDRLADERGKLVERLAKLDRAEARVVRKMSDESISEAVGDEELTRITDERERLNEQVIVLDGRLTASITPAKRKSVAMLRAKITSVTDPGSIRFEDARKLVEEVFAGAEVHGRKPGVYIHATEDGFDFEVVGVVVTQGSVEAWSIDEELSPEDCTKPRNSGGATTKTSSDVAKRSGSVFCFRPSFRATPSTRRSTPLRASTLPPSARSTTSDRSR